jgi:hypothetical protein
MKKRLVKHTDENNEVWYYTEIKVNGIWEKSSPLRLSLNVANAEYRACMGKINPKYEVIFEEEIKLTS